MSPAEAQMPEQVSKLQMSEHQAGDVIVLRLSGEMTVDDGDIAFGKHVDTLVKKGQVKIVVDLSNVTYIDSAGVGMMVAEMKLVRQAGGLMKLSNLTARSHRLLAMLKLKVVFEVFDDEAAAVRSFAWGLR
jgi:anti-sigma B factor antagonist